MRQTKEAGGTDRRIKEREKGGETDFRESGAYRSGV